MFVSFEKYSEPNALGQRFIVTKTAPNTHLKLIHEIVIRKWSDGKYAGSEKH